MSKWTDEDYRHFAAYHEAAHALTAIRLGLPLISSSIEDIERIAGLGAVPFAEGKTRLDEKRMQELEAARNVGALEAWRIMVAAGFLGSPPPDGIYSSPNDHQTYARLTRILNRIPEPAPPDFARDVEAHKPESASQAEDILSDPGGGYTTWGAVAAALLIAGKLSKEQVQTITAIVHESRNLGVWYEVKGYPGVQGDPLLGSYGSEAGAVAAAKADRRAFAVVEWKQGVSGARKVWERNS